MTSPRLGRLPAETPATIAMSARARALRAEGHDVVSLAIGEPDFPTPAHVVEAAHRAAREGQTTYTPVEGTPALRRAIAGKLARENGLTVAEDEIIVTAGGKQAIHDAFAATLDPGSEVVIPSPYWASYPLIARMQGATPVFVESDPADGFRIDPDALAAAITPATCWVVLNSPNNPTGAVLDRARLEAIAQVLVRHPHVWILSDDIYEHMIHDGSPHATLAAVAPALADRTLTIGGVSKSHAMTGWRIGWASGPRALIRRMAVVQGNTTSGASSVGQAASVAAIEGDQTHLAERARAYRDRRDLVLEALSGAAGLTTTVPEGAFYLFPSVHGLIGRTSAGGRRLGDDVAIAHALLEEAHVATVPGVAFGASPFLRLSIAADEERLRTACGRIVAFCGAAT